MRDLETIDIPSVVKMTWADPAMVAFLNYVNQETTQPDPTLVEMIAILKTRLEGSLPLSSVRDVETYSLTPLLTLV